MPRHHRITAKDSMDTIARRVHCPCAFGLLMRTTNAIDFWRGNANFLAKDGFHLNDLGYRCMAEYAAGAIVSGIVQADAEANPSPAN